MRDYLKPSNCVRQIIPGRRSKQSVDELVNPGTVCGASSTDTVPRVILLYWFAVISSGASLHGFSFLGRIR